MKMEAEAWKLRATTLDTKVKRLKRLHNGPTEPAGCQRTINFGINQSCRVMAFNENDKLLVSVN